MATSITACFARVAKTLSPEDREQVLAPLRRDILAQLDAQRSDPAWKSRDTAMDSRALAVQIIDRMLAADTGEAAAPAATPAATPAPAPAPTIPAPTPAADLPTDADLAADQELQDALGKLGDVLGDVFGAKKNITGPQYSAADLLPTLSKVVELLVRKGFRSFKAATARAAQLMRGNAATAPHVDAISPRQWKAAYNAIAEGHDGTDSEEAVGALTADEVRGLVAAPEQAQNPAREPTQPPVGATDSVRGEAPGRGRGAPAQQRPAQVDPGDVGAREPGDVAPAPAAPAGRSPGEGPASPDVGTQEGSDGVGPAGDGRPRAGGTRDADARAGSRGRKPAAGRGKPAPVDPTSVSPANTGPGDFVIDDPLRIVGGGQVARFEKNKAAIELRNRLVEEGRAPTREEQEVLAGYTGWGSFGQELFQGNWERPAPKAGWEERDRWLRDNLGRKEWEGMQTSIINAHYTDPPTVLAMWDMVRRMGFTGGRVLEPSIGIGNFYGMMPADLTSRSQRAGIELDPVTGSMAQMLYPSANIQIKGYEKSTTPDNFYDLVIGNWPFFEQGPADRRYNRLSPTLHDYFFLKAIDQTKPGGLVVGITTHGTMDKKGIGARMEMARKAELVAAFRLPTGAFQEYAGTKVVTDIIILRKRAQPTDLVAKDGWIDVLEHNTAEGTKVWVNEYFHRHPEHVIGRIDFGHGTTTFRPGLIVHRPDNMMAELRRIVDMVPEGAFKADQTGKRISYVANHTSDRTNALVKTDKGLFIVQGEYLAPANEVLKYELKSPTKTAERVRELESLIDMRRLYGRLIDAERAGNADKERTALREAYEAFVKRSGTLADSFGLSYLERIDDPFYPSLAALEVDGKPAAILSRSTMRWARSIENPSISDAFVLARAEAVNPTLERIAAIAKKPQAEVKAALIESGAAYELPNGDFAASDIYLSGNVREKLRAAKAALESGNAAMQRNVDALTEVQPPTIPYYKIETQMGATWVPAAAYEEYIAHMLGMDKPDGISVKFEAGSWKVEMDGALNHRPQASSGAGVPHVKFKRLVRAAIANQTITVKRKGSDGVEYVDDTATKETNAAISDMRTKFGEWLWSDPTRRVQLEAEYNEVRNAYATPRFDGSFLGFQGMALSLGRGPFNLRQHQANAIWRALVTRKSLNAHEVGTGKTFTMGGIAVESRRYGIAKKPLILAHNANSKSVAHEIQQMYPAARVLYVDNLSKENVKTRMLQIANDDWDAVVVPHSLIGRIGFKEETLMGMAKEEIDDLELAAQEAAAEDNVTITKEMWEDEEELAKLRSATAKQLVKARLKIITTIQKLAQQASREDSVAFEDLGIDMVMVDEAHEFKKPPIATKMKMKGLQTATSDRSIALMFMTKYIRAMNGGANVHLFTGTPITNTMTEVFHMMRYMMQEEMKDAALADWDGWFGSFAREVTDVELNPAGEYEAVTRLQSFINVPELRRMIGQYMDVVFAEDMPEMQLRLVNGKRLTDKDLTDEQRRAILQGRTENALDRPYKKVVNENSDMTPEQLRVFERVQGYARSWRNMTKKDRKEAMLSGAPESPIIHEGIAARASFDVRLVDAIRNAGLEGTPAMEPHPNSKPARVVKNLLEIYRSHPEANQVVFMEQGMSKSVTRREGPVGNKRNVNYPAFSTVHDMIERLVQAGVPREQIALVDGSTSKDKRKEVADAMNSGKIRIVFGSTDSLGVGVNMQRNLRAMHHMDAPWMPGELEQRNGRGHRQGNQWNTVMEFRYLTDRLDGRRWQVLAIKQKFITDFMKSKGDVRVIEGDAADDSGGDILATFSEAAGDPRLLLREKYKKKLEHLQSRERIHGNAVADAKRAVRDETANMEDAERRLDALRQAGARDAIDALVKSTMGDGFNAVIGGEAFDERAPALIALRKWIVENVRKESPEQKVGTFGGHEVFVHWLYKWADEPSLVLKFPGDVQVTASPSWQSLETQLRNKRDTVEATWEEAIKTAREKIAHARKVTQEPFHLKAQLDDATKRLADLEEDIARNPVAPPYWLRSGAPADTDVVFNDKTFTVTGHRWSDAGWFVVARDDRGEIVIPYMEARDTQGMPLYEEREFEKPTVQQGTAAQGVPTKAPAAPKPTAADDLDFRIDAADLPADTAAAYAAAPSEADQRAVRRLQMRMARYIPGVRLDAVAAAGGREAGQPLQGADRARVAAAELLRALTGRRAVFFKADRAKFVNGVHSSAEPDVLFLRADASRPHMAVMGHEFLHGLRADRPDLYEALRDRIRMVAPGRAAHGADLQAKRASVAQPLLDADKLEEEFLADVMGDSWMDAGFWRDLAGKEPDGPLRKAFRAAFRFISDVLGKLADMNPFGSDVYLSDVRAARKAMAQALREYVQVESVGAPEVGVDSFSTDERAPWYSALERAIAAQPMRGGGAGAWENAVKGLLASGKVKADEVEWSGLREWLAMQPGLITRAAVQQYLQANGVQVQETVLGGGDAFAELESAIVEADALGFTFARDVFEDGDEYTGRAIQFTRRRDGVTFGWNGRNFVVDDYPSNMKEEDIDPPQDALIDVARDIKALSEAERDGADADGTKYSQYTLPGGPLARDTEILSRDGWLRMDEVQVGDVVMTRRDEDGRLEWQEVEAVPTVHADKLYHFKNQSIDMRVTACHNMLVKRRRRSSAGLFRAKAADLWGMSECVAPLVGEWRGEATADLYGYRPEDAAELIGWYIAEGSAVTEGGKKSTLAISQSREANPEKCARIEALLARMGIAWNYVASGPSYYLSIKTMDRGLVDVLHAQGDSRDKFVPGFIFDQPPAVLRSLMDGMLLGDGHLACADDPKREPRWAYFTNSKRLADDMQTLALLCGLRATIGKRPTGLYEVRLNSKQWASIDDAKHAIVDYNDTAFCVTVKNHAIYVRTGGVAAFTGNSNYREVLLTLPNVPRNDQPQPLDALPPGYEAIFDSQERQGQQWGITEPGQMHARPWAGRHADPEAARAAALKKLNAERLAKWREAAPEYRSNHWDQYNVLAHIRLNDRTDADGKRVLFVEEIQSDWAQQAKKDGFVGDLIPQNTAWEAVDTLDEFDTREQAQAWADTNPPPNPGANMEARLVVNERERFGWAAGQPSRWVVVEEQRSTVSQAPQLGGLPRAPFVDKTDKWVTLALKRIVKMAVDEGYDRVAMTTGKQQADRYGLDKQADKVVVTPRTDMRTGEKTRSVAISLKAGGVLTLGVDRNGVIDNVNGPIAGQHIEGKALDDVIGKEMAERVMAVERATFEGEDLRVGGRGMMAFYDRIVPSALKDLLRKVGGGAPTTVAIGAQREISTNVDDGAGGVLKRREMTGATLKQPGFDITPKMREQAAGGMPMFSLAPRQQTETPEFKRWFGDSKVVDAQGKPLVVYHGTKNDTDFGAFNTPAHFGTAEQANTIAESFFRFGAPADALGDSPRVMPVYLSIKDPIYIKDTGVQHGPVEYLEAAYERGAISFGEREAILYDENNDRRDDAEIQRLLMETLEGLGYDGFIYDNKMEGEGTSYTVFRPEQIKSAIGNSGAFDPNEADINFSIAVDTLQSNDTARRLAERAMDVIRSDSTIGVLGRTVGTPYHLAHAKRADGSLRNPDLRRVYDEAQDYLNDINTFANDPAELAPGVVPMLNKWSDARKPLRLAAEKRANLARALFDGTLGWTRDDQGNPVESDDARGAGIEWTATELKQRFGFDDADVKLYQQTRAAIARSLDFMAAAEVARQMGGRDLPEGLRAMVSRGDTGRFRGLVTNFLTQQVDGAQWALRMLKTEHREQLAAITGPEADAKRAALKAKQAIALEVAQERLDKWQGLQRGVAKVYDRVTDLKDRGYMPLMRFGPHTVTVRDIDTKQVLFFGMYETQAEANVEARRLRESAEPNEAVTRGEMSQEQWRLFKGMSPETIELFGQVAGVERTPVFEEYIRRTKANHSALKRLIQRKGTPGFSEDVQRVLAAFLTSNARAAAANLHAGAMEEATLAIDQERGLVKDYATRLTQYVQNPTDEAQGIRGLMFIQFIGGSVASALVNMTQPFTMTLPYLSQHGGPGAASRLLTAGMRKALTKIDPQSPLGVAMQRAEKDGIVSPQALHELQGQAVNRFGRIESGLRSLGVSTKAAEAIDSNLRRVLFAWGGFFSLAEQFNRRATFAAAYQLAQERQMADPFEFASEAVSATQGVYNRGNRPQWARGPVGATVMTFKQFSISYLEFLSRLPRREKAIALGVLMVAAGLEGLPFADDLDDLIDTIMQRLFGKAFSAKRAKVEALTAMGMSRDSAEWVLRGASALPGFPVDLAGRMSLGNMIPGTGVLRTDGAKDKSAEVLEALGPAGGVVRDALRGEFSPVAVRNAFKGAEMFRTGQYRDELGRKVADVDGADAAAKALGFQPREIARESRGSRMAQSVVAQTRAAESDIVRLWAQGIADNEPDKVAEARAQLEAWNQRNPEARIAINRMQIARQVRDMRATREERLIRATPKELRGRVAQELQQ